MYFLSHSAGDGFPGLRVMTNGVLSMVFVLDWYCRLLVCVMEETLVIAESIKFRGYPLFISLFFFFFFISWHLFSNVLLSEQICLIRRHWL